MSWQPPLPEPPGAGPGDPGLPPPPSSLTLLQGPTYATFWRRVGARFLDELIVGIPLIVVLVSIVSQAGADGGAGTGLSPEDADRLYTAGLLTLAISALYEISLTALRGQTLGKMALGIKVVPAEGAGSVGWGWSSLRWLIPNAAARLPGLGSLLNLLVWAWMLWDPRKQGLHDKAARTLVIRSRQAGRG